LQYQSDKKGSILIESIFIIYITIIVFGMTVPFYFKFISKTKLELSTHEVCSIFNTARSYAITNNKTCEVLIPVEQTVSPFDYKKIKLVIDEGASGYRTVEEWQPLKEGIKFDPRITVGAEPHSTFLKYDPPPGGSDNRVELRPFPDDTSPEALVAVIKFKPDGGLKKAGSLSLIFENDDSKGKTITVENINARVRVSDF
ncbi:MAG: hypothetical protein Q7S42_04735, partial [Candidatus Omnitrophota bacterium]|nr:hypothetical protein [Candidatus Omnitrophota bacterium]